MSQHQLEDSCGVAQLLSLHRESIPREPNPTVWSWQSFLQPSQVRANPAEPGAALQVSSCARKQPQKCLGGGCSQGGPSSLAEALGMGSIHQLPAPATKGDDRG